MSEFERLNLILERDGLVAADEFARRTMKIYRTSVLKTGRNNRAFHFASHGDYRRRFIESYLYFKKWLATGNAL